jgi:hypothetical protein
MSVEEDYPLRESDKNELDDDVVLVTSSTTGGGRKYHTDPSCRYLTDSHTEWDRDVAVSWGFEECTNCANGFPWNE